MKIPNCITLVVLKKAVRGICSEDFGDCVSILAAGATMKYYCSFVLLQFLFVLLFVVVGKRKRKQKRVGLTLNKYLHYKFKI